MNPRSPHDDRTNREQCNVADLEEEINDEERVSPTQPELPLRTR